MKKSAFIGTIYLTLILSLIGLAVYEIGAGLMQLCGLTPAHHSMQSFTGDFYNIGPYACFLAVVFPLILRWVLSPEQLTHTSPRRIAAMIILFPMAVLIPASLSRTAWVACLVGGGIATLDSIRRWLVGRRNTAFTCIVLTGVITLFFAGAYSIKSNSADGRLLLWKTATIALEEHPFSGVGWNNVAGALGDAQEAYFTEYNVTDKEKFLAGAPECAFNEYLQVAIAFGIPTAIMMITLIFGALMSSLFSKNYGIAGCVVAVAITMSASYPLQFPVFVLAISLILCISYLKPPKGTTWASVIGCAATIAFCGMLLQVSWFPPDIAEGFQRGKSLHDYGYYTESNKALLALLPNTSDAMPLNIIGKNYQAMGMLDSADHYFLRATRRCPNRLYPHYLRMLLHSENEVIDSVALLEAKTLLEMPIKVHSPAIYSMRCAATKIIKEGGNQ